MKNTWSQFRRDIPFLLLIAIVVAILGSFVISAKSWSVLGPLTTQVKTNEKVVALTFDDGPTSDETTKLLKTLESEHVKATFYLIGLEMVRHPAAADAIVAAGHEVGNHGFTHSSLMFMDWETLSSEIQKTDSLIRSHGYLGPITIRPPFGHKLVELPVYAAMNERRIIMWDKVLGNKPGASVASILNDAKPVHAGSIIIMHTMYAHNKTALESVGPLIRQLKSQGYRFVTVSELLNYR